MATVDRDVSDAVARAHVGTELPLRVFWVTDRTKFRDDSGAGVAFYAFDHVVLPFLFGSSALGAQT